MAVREAGLPSPVSSGAAREDALRLGGAAMAAATVFSFAAFAAVTALVARTLSPGEFGVWSILAALPGLAANLDFGLGNAVRNKLAGMPGPGERREQGRTYFLGAFRVLLLIGAAVLAGAFLSYFFFPWRRVFSSAPAGALESWRIASVAALAGVALCLPFGLSSSGFFGFQEPHLQAVGEACRPASLLIAAAAAWSRSWGLVFLVAAANGLILICRIAAFAVFMRRRAWSLFPLSGGGASAPRPRRGLSSSSLPFALLQIGAAVIVSTDAIIVSQTSDFASAGEYSVVQRLFLLLITAQAFLLTPLWSAYTEAHARGERAWVREKLAKSFATTLLLNVGGAALLALAGRLLFRVWTGRELLQVGLLPAMAAWAAVYALSNCFSVFLNALGVLRRQAALAVAGALVNVPLAFVLGRLWGPVGVCVAGIAVIAPSALNNWLETKRELERIGTV